MNLAIIQARLESTRFPGKVLAEVAGKPLLLRVIERVKEAKLVDRVVVATPRNGGATIKGHCDEWGCECMVMPQPEDDVLARFVAVAEKCDADLVVRVCGDNPMINPRGIDELIEAAIESGTDYTGYQTESGSPMILVPSGWFAEVVKSGALRRVDRELTKGIASIREDVTRWIYIAPPSRKYTCHWLPLPAWYVDNNLPNTAIDRPEDIEALEEWLSEFDNEENWPWK